MLAKAFQKRDCAFLCVFLAVAFLMPWETRTYAQIVGATLSGTVTDGTGAIVPNVHVSIKATATGITRDITVDTVGFYTATNLLPGNYEVTFSASGFATQVSSGVNLTVGAQQVLNVSLRVGQISQQVTVTGEAPTVELASSALNAVVEAPTIVGLPLNGRSWTDLASLQPGVAGVETQVPFGDSGRGNRGFGAQIIISGARPTQNNYRLDGISLNDYSNGGPGSVLGGNLGVDAVEEFSVLTSTFSAEYGKTSGGVVNAISRAGTNQFHGNAYEFLRNSALDARNFFDPPTIPAFHRNQFGSSIGGPIRKDKTFFFGDYEGIRQSKGVGKLDTVPSLAARGIGPSGQPTVALVCFLAPNAPPPCTPNTPLPAQGQPGAAPNPDPTTHIDAAVLPYLLGMYPLPNGPAIAGTDTANFNFVGHRIVREDFFTIRVDHHFSQKDSVFGTYMFDRTPFTSDEPLGVVLLGALTKRQIVAIEETHSFTQNLVNTVRLGYNRDTVDNNQPVAAILPAAADHSLAAIPGRYANACLCPNVGTFMEGGLGGTPTYLYRWNSYQVYDDAFLTRGRHSLKFGFGYERDQDNQLVTGDRNGQFSFGSMQALLTNRPNKIRITPPGLLTERSLRQSIVGAYLQDDWRFRPSLMLNLGLRYEMSTVPFDTQGQTATLYNLTDPQPHCGRLVTGCVAAGPFFYNPTLRSFAPRVGFAWDPFPNGSAKGKTAVRGGFGIFDSLPLMYQYLTLIGQVAPFYELIAASNLPVGSFPSGAYNFVTTPGNGKSTPQYASLEPHPHRNYVMQWSLNIQRELTHDLTATVGYVGTHGVHQPFRVDDADQVMPTLTSAGYLYPQVDSGGNKCIANTQCAATTGNPPAKLNDNAGDIRYLNWAASSSYHALQVGVVKRLNHGFQIQGSFTWGKSIDNNSGVIAGDQFSNSISSMDWFDLHLSRGLSDYNVGRTLVINATWLVPSIKSLSGPLAWPLNGWQLSAVFKANDGVPFSALFGAQGPDPRGTLSSDDYAYPSGVAGCNPIDLNFRNNPNGPLYINPKTSCFTVPMAPNQAFWNANCDPAPPSVGAALAPGDLSCFNLRGNVGRNTLIGPGLTNLDFSVFKNNYIRRISESFNVQFRAELFNIMNHANFNVPSLGDGNTNMLNGDGTVNGGAGLLTQTTTDPREIQFAIKVIW
jgi:Carboxypeptidase regulatory-like domain/TonB dependent receptor/TonB-dependent Receptor Plug Domain